MKDDERQGLRKKILAARDRMQAGERRDKSRLAVQNFLQLPEFAGWSTLFVYVNFRSELETVELIRQCLARGKRVAVPLVNAAENVMEALLIEDPEKDLAPGYFGIPEPDPHRSPRVAGSEIDVAVIPGSVFDVSGGRLGYGGGYYDRFLVNDAPRARRVALAFEMQLVERVPLEPHDQPLDILVTEKRVVTIRP